MKITSVELHPSGSSDICVLSFRDPSRANAYNVKAMVGLDADSIVARYYKGLGSSKAYNLSLEKRDVVIRIGLNPDFSQDETYSDLRDDIYRMIASSRTGLLQIQFKNDLAVLGVVSGFVQKVEAPHFQQEPEVQITVECLDPMIRGLDPINVDISGTFFDLDESYNRLTLAEASGEDGSTLWGAENIKSTSYLLNGSFADTSHWGGYHTVPITVDTGELVMQNTDASGAWGAFSDMIPAKFGEEWTISFLARSLHRGRAYISFVGSTDFAGDWITLDPNINTPLSLTAVAPAGTTGIIAYVMFENENLLGDGKTGRASVASLTQKNGVTDGTHAFRMRTTGLGVNFIEPPVSLPAFAGEEYTFALDLTPLRFAGSVMAPCIKFLDAANNVLQDTNTIWNTVMETTRRSHTATAPAGTTQVKPYIAILPSFEAELIDMDRLSFKKGTDTTYEEPRGTGYYAKNITDDLSTAPHGLTFDIKFNLGLAQIVITDPDDDSWYFTLTPAGGFLTGDVLHFSSEFNKKELYIVRDGVNIPIADAIETGSTWPIIFPGLNRFAIANAANLVWNSLSYLTAYWGV